MNSLFSQEHTEALIERIQQLTPEQQPQWGKLTAEQWAIGMYKHTSHHLKQFGV